MLRKSDPALEASLFFAGGDPSFAMGHVGGLSDIGTEQNEPYPFGSVDRFGNPSPLQTTNLRPVDGALAF